MRRLRLLLASVAARPGMCRSVLEGTRRFRPALSPRRLGRPGRHELVRRAGSQRGRVVWVDSSSSRATVEPQGTGCLAKPRGGSRAILAGSAPARPRAPLGGPWTDSCTDSILERPRTDRDLRTAARARIAPRRTGNRGRPWSPIAACWNAGSRPSSSRCVNGSKTKKNGSRKRKLEALGEFAGGAGHELNNPLAVIVGRAQLLLARTDDPETARSLAHHPQPGRACSSHSPRSDVRGASAGPQAADLPPGRSSSRMPARFSRRMHCQGHSSCRRDRRLDTRTSSSIPTALRHLAEILLRNAIQATPAGGKILVRSSNDGDELSGVSATQARGSLPTRRPTCSIRFSAAGRRDAAWASACRARPGSSRRPADACTGRQTRPWINLPGPLAPLTPARPPEKTPRSSSASAKTGDRPPKT